MKWEFYEKHEGIIDPSRQIDTVGNNYDAMRTELLSTKLDTIKEQQDDILNKIRESKY